MFPNHRCKIWELCLSHVARSGHTGTSLTHQATAYISGPGFPAVDPAESETVVHPPHQSPIRRTTPEQSHAGGGPGTQA